MHDMSSQENKQIASRVARNIRIARGDQSQREFAKALDVDPTYVSRWERGLVMPTYSRIESLAKTTERPVEWFFADNSSEQVAA